MADQRTASSSAAGGGRTAPSNGHQRAVPGRIGKYEVEAETGHTSLGRVFRAFDRDTGRPVSLAVLTEVAGRPLAERFRREVAIAANLRCASLAAIYELGEHLGLPFAAIEYLGDDTLRRAIDARRPLTLFQKTLIMWQVAEGLQAAHGAGLAHVGIRPSGIALGAGGRAIIHDFGIVRMAPDEPSYSSPEELAGNSPDSLSDIFAWGAIYYELLAGVHPFPGDPPPLRELSPECPEALDRLVHRAIDRRSELRYQSLDEIQYDADPILRDLKRRHAAALLGEARRFMDARELENARAAVREALELDPDNRKADRLHRALRDLLHRDAVRPRLEALWREADEEAAARRFDRAVEILRSALRLDAAEPESRSRLERMCERLEESCRCAQLLAEARQLLDRQAPADARAKVLEALERDPGNPDVAELLRAIEIERELAKAKSFLLLQSFDQAIAVLRDLSVEFPGSPLVEHWLAHVETQKAEAGRHARFEARLGEALSLLGEERFAAAVEILEPLAAEFPGEARLPELLGQAREAMERACAVAEALAECDRLCREGQFSSGLKVLDAALAVHRNDSLLLQKRRDVESQYSVRPVLEEARWLLEQDRPDLAVQFLREKAAAFSNEPELAAQLAAVEDLLPAWQKRRFIQDAVRRAAALEQLQQWSVALTVIEEALETCPGAEVLLEAAGRLRAQLQDREHRKKVARLTAEVRQCLADGDIAQAEEILRKGAESLGDEPALGALREEVEAGKSYRVGWQAAQLLFGRRQFQEAERILVALAAPDRPDVDALLATVREARAAGEEQNFYNQGREKALKLMEQRQFEQAADMLRNLLSLFPADPILERDLQAARAACPADVVKAPVVEAPPPPLPVVQPVFRVESRARPRWAVIGVPAVLLLVSGSAAVWSLSRTGSPPPPPARSQAAAPVPAVPAPAAPPQPVTPAPAAPAAYASTPQPHAKAAREARPKSFSLSALSKPAGETTPAPLVAPPPDAAPVVPAREAPALAAQPPKPVLVPPPPANPAPKPAQPSVPAAGAGPRRQSSGSQVRRLPSSLDARRRTAAWILRRGQPRSHG